MCEVGLSVDIVNNISDNSLFGQPPNNIDPVLLAQLCEQSNGRLICLDINDVESRFLCEQYILSFLEGEYGYDCVFRIRSSGGVLINSIMSQGLDTEHVGIHGLQFSSNSSDVNHIAFIHSSTTIPFDFQYNSPRGCLVEMVSS